MKRVHINSYMGGRAFGFQDNGEEVMVHHEGDRAFNAEEIIGAIQFVTRTTPEPQRAYFWLGAEAEAA